MKKRVLFVAHDSTLYGANRSLLDLVSSLRSKSDMKIVLVFPKRNRLICQQLDKLKYKYYIINYRTEIIGSIKQKSNIFIDFLKLLYKHFINIPATYKLSKILLKEEINIIHSNSGVITIGEKLAKRKNIPHVWHLREFIDLDHDMRIFGGLEKYKKRIQNSDKIISISHGVAKHLGVNSKAFIIHDAVAVHKGSHSEKKTDKYFLFCGTLKAGKGIETAIQAFNLFSLPQHNFKLLIAGTGEKKYESYLKNLVVELELNDQVEFLGFRNDIASLMSGASAFLMCSENEALGRVTIEAMLSHCPVIGYDKAGTAEIMTTGKTGLLYKDLNQLVEQIKYLIENRKEIELIKTKAYRYACEAFSEKNYGDKLHRYYSNILDK